MTIDGRNVPCVQVFYRPRTLEGVIVDIKQVDRIPNNAAVSNYYGMWTKGVDWEFPENGITFYFFYDPVDDVVYVRSFSSSSTVPSRLVRLFTDSSVYQFLRWPYVTKGAVDPDIDGVQEKITGGMLPMLLLLLGCGIGLKLLDYGSIKLMRFWDDKDSQRALARINNIDDPLEHKVALEAHRNAYNARFKRYAKEDRQRRRR